MTPLARSHAHGALSNHPLNCPPAQSSALSNYVIQLPLPAPNERPRPSGRGRLAARTRASYALIVALRPKANSGECEVTGRFASSSSPSRGISARTAQWVASDLRKARSSGRRQLVRFAQIRASRLISHQGRLRATACTQSATRLRLLGRWDGGRRSPDIAIRRPDRLGFGRRGCRQQGYCRQVFKDVSTASHTGVTRPRR